MEAPTGLRERLGAGSIELRKVQRARRGESTGHRESGIVDLSGDGAVEVAAGDGVEAVLDHRGSVRREGEFQRSVSLTALRRVSPLPFSLVGRCHGE